MAKFTLPKLPYEHNALEPQISEDTLKLHHDKHHQAYCDKFNAALESAGVETDNIMEIFQNISKYPIAIRNHGGGYFNHMFYFESMKKASDENPQGELLEAIEKSFGSFEEFKNKFSASAGALFGSGWTWLGVKSDGSLTIYNTQNQDNCFMNVINEDSTPILVIDVWEHAYYVDYQNRRPEYIGKFFEVINWEKVSERFNNALN